MTDLSQLLANLPDRGSRYCSDAERERAVGHLKQAYVDGRLELEEFHQRTELVMGSRTRGQLAAAFDGLARLDTLNRQLAVREGGRRIARFGRHLAQAVVVAGWFLTGSAALIIWLATGNGAIPLAMVALATVGSLGLLMLPRFIPALRKEKSGTGRRSPLR